MRTVTMLTVAMCFLLAPAVLSAQHLGETPHVMGGLGATAPYAGYFGYQPGPGMSMDNGGSLNQEGGLWSIPSSGAPNISVPITSNKALEIVETYLRKTNNDDLRIRRLFEYNTHFEAELVEQNTRRGAFEIIVDKFNGRVYPEPGPNLVWNAKYGINANYFGVQPALTVGIGEALRSVGDFIKRTSPELKVEGDVTEYFGFYEFHVTLDGKLAIEVNVNGFNGQLWIENWHGSVLRQVTVAEE